VEPTKALGAVTAAADDNPQIDQLGGKVDATATSRRQARLELFERRCRDLARQVAEGHLPFIHAVDCAYDAATWSGLADDVGDDEVQLAMARAFMQVRQ
jgi:hypothetical protein